MRWRDAGVDVHFLCLRFKLGVGQAIQFRARQGHHLAGDEVQFFGDSQRSVLVIAGDHNRLDAGVPGQGHGVFDLRPGRIDHADETDESQASFYRFGSWRDREFRQRAIGHAQHPQRV